MNDTRARFEEIWPVPEGVEWNQESGKYEPPSYMSESEWEWLFSLVSEHTARLETFTRCQETTDVYVSLINEFIDCINNDWNEYSAADLANRAIHALGEKK